jgi:hypothetical protein
MTWKFEDPENVAVFVNRKAMRGDGWIARVVHDDDDGAWQFHAHESEEFDDEDIMILALRKIVDSDETVMELADLPYGWHAWRETKSSPWKRARIVGVS